MRKILLILITIIIISCNKRLPKVQFRQHCAGNAEQAAWVLQCIQGFPYSNGKGVPQRVVQACKSSAQDLGIGECKLVAKFHSLGGWRLCTDAVVDEDIKACNTLTPPYTRALD